MCTGITGRIISKKRYLSTVLDTSFLKLVTLYVSFQMKLESEFAPIVCVKLLKDAIIPMAVWLTFAILSGTRTRTRFWYIRRNGRAEMYS